MRYMNVPITVEKLKPRRIRSYHSTSLFYCPVPISLYAFHVKIRQYPNNDVFTAVKFYMMWDVINSPFRKFCVKISLKFSRNFTIILHLGCITNQPSGASTVFHCYVDDFVFKSENVLSRVLKIYSWMCRFG